MSSSVLRARRRSPAIAAPVETDVAPIEPRKDVLEAMHTDIDTDTDQTASILDILRIFTGLILVSTLLSYFITGNSLTWGYSWPARLSGPRIRAWLDGPLYLTDAELARYNGTDTTLPILLGLNGSIFDVSAAPETYGPGGSYGMLAGRDATRAFVTGCFDVDLNGDLRGVEEIFVPVEFSVEGEIARLAELKGAEKGVWKTKRDQVRRQARQQVFNTVDGWRRFFDAGGKGKYFWRGELARGPETGWSGWGDLKPLCERARSGRRRKEAADVS